MSLSTGKIYVGHVIRGIDPEQERTELRLLPVLSGYRTEKGIVDFTNMYEAVLKILREIPVEKINTQKDLEKANLGDMEIVIPFSEIVHAGLFNFKVYKETNDSIRKEFG